MKVDSLFKVLRADRIRVQEHEPVYNDDDKEVDFYSVKTVFEGIPFNCPVSIAHKDINRIFVDNDGTWVINIVTK